MLFNERFAIFFFEFLVARFLSIDDLSTFCVCLLFEYGIPHQLHTCAMVWSMGIFICFHFGVIPRKQQVFISSFLVCYLHYCSQIILTRGSEQ